MSDVTSGESPRKRPWVAVLLAIIYPGLGHVYLRKWGRALLWFVLIITSTTFMIPEEAFPSALSLEAIQASARMIPLEIGLLILALSFMSVLDAYLLANRLNEAAGSTVNARPGGEAESCPSCGKTLDEDLDFCPWCSERLVDPSPETDEANTQ